MFGVKQALEPKRERKNTHECIPVYTIPTPSWHDIIYIRGGTTKPTHFTYIRVAVSSFITPCNPFGGETSLFFFRFFFSIPCTIFALLFSLPPSKSNPGSRGRLFSLLPTTVRALHFYREKISAPCVQTINKRRSHHRLHTKQPRLTAAVWEASEMQRKKLYKNRYVLMYVKDTRYHVSCIMSWDGVTQAAATPRPEGRSLGLLILIMASTKS